MQKDGTRTSVCMLPVGTSTYSRELSELSRSSVKNKNKKRALIALHKDLIRSHLKTLRNLLLPSLPQTLAKF